ncbi:hypothetical protein NW759_002232 [Fusarium solani]|uniref:Uncharacterized protein n=1 Tax=Fusarium solani TaxID=169388 RepID=A0A9P9KIF5_FUSSL|nr:uncharacterized protein B0J15DRAFT_546945 [Fusarium solani]KAH7264177.1 hypothetical protein B0J15DRAFT_546945 [Fusarium solani]KAJ4233456.1 hypothetical protein NW759_002232 [Fusarium solani]
MPLNVSPPPTLHSLNPEAADDLEAQQSTTENLQTDNGIETRGPGARVLQLAALRESDPTHILFRRFTELASLSLDLEGNHLEQLGHDLRQMILTGEDGVNDFNDKFLGKLRRYYQVGSSLRKVLGFDGPSQQFLADTLSSAKQSWAPGQGLHLNASDHDFASLLDTDKFDQILTYWPHKSWARRFLNKFNPRTEQGGGFEAIWIPGEYVRFISVGVFNTCVGIFVVAPMAIQTLKVTTPAGEVVTYLVFVLIAGFAIQMLVPGFTRQLLVYLAYAGVMAAVMRQ